MKKEEYKYKITSDKLINGRERTHKNEQTEMETKKKIILKE